MTHESDFLFKIKLGKGGTIVLNFSFSVALGLDAPILDSAVPPYATPEPVSYKILCTTFELCIYKVGFFNKHYYKLE